MTPGPISASVALLLSGGFLHFHYSPQFVPTVDSEDEDCVCPEVVACPESKPEVAESANDTIVTAPNETQFSLASAGLWSVIAALAGWGLSVPRRRIFRARRVVVNDGARAGRGPAVEELAPRLPLRHIVQRRA